MSAEAIRAASPQVTLEDALSGDGGRTLADDARHGLTRTLKQLPPKHLYDLRGAELSDRIRELPEQTRPALSPRSSSASPTS